MSQHSHYICHLAIQEGSELWGVLGQHCGQPGHGCTAAYGECGANKWHLSYARHRPAGHKVRSASPLVLARVSQRYVTFGPPGRSQLASLSCSDRSTPLLQAASPSTCATQDWQGAGLWIWTFPATTRSCGLVPQNPGQSYGTRLLV